MTATRPYRMAARGRAVAATRERIVSAIETLGMRDLEFDPTLEAVAAEAGVSVQTVLRHFGSRENLLTVAFDEVEARIRQERMPLPHDVDDALRVLVAHYESRGDVVLVMLARERTDERVRAATTRGKRQHREWVSDVFADRLPDGPEREALLDLLVVATDVYAWQLLRRDRGHSPATVTARMRSLTDAILRA